MSLIHGTTPSQSRLSVRKPSPHHSLRQDLEVDVCVRRVVLTLLPTSPSRGDVAAVEHKADGKEGIEAK